jgi:hypothetical protein
MVNIGDHGQERDLGNSTIARWLSLPGSGLCPQNRDTAQSIGNRVPLVGRSAVVQGKNGLPIVDLKFG